MGGSKYMKFEKPVARESDAFNKKDICWRICVCSANELETLAPCKCFPFYDSCILGYPTYADMYLRSPYTFSRFAASLSSFTHVDYRVSFT